MPRLSISIKYSLLILFSIISTSILISVFVLDLISKEVNEQLVLRGESVTQQLAYTLAPGLLGHDEAKIRAALNNVLKDRDIISGMVLDSDNIIVASKDQSQIGQPPRDSALLAMVQHCRSEMDHVTEERLIFFHQSLFSNVVVGCVVIQVSRMVVDKTIHKATQRVLSLTCAIAFTVILLSFITLRRTLKPLAMVVHGTRQISQGDFSTRLSIKSRDELGDLASAFNGMAARTELFFRYVDKSIAERLARDESLVKPGGNLKQASVLFGDMRNFTELSNRKTPREVVSILNTYFDLFIQIVHHYRGVVDKMMGDAIMAFYEPQRRDDNSHAKRATLSAIAMRSCVWVLGQVLRQAQQESIPVKVESRLFGFAVATGRLIVGNIGSNQHMDYTLCGPAVNLAARLQQDTKQGEVIIDRFTNIDVENLILTHQLAQVLPKGFAPEHEVIPFQVIGLVEVHLEPIRKILRQIFTRTFFARHVLDSQRNKQKHLDRLSNLAKHHADRCNPTEFLVL